MKRDSPELKKSPSFIKVLRENREFLSSPLTVVLTTVSLFFIAQLLGSVLALPIIAQVSSQNIQLLAIIFFSTLSLYLVILLLKKVFRFKLKSIGVIWPSLKHILQAVPAFVLYFVVSAGFTAFAIRFIPGFNSEQAQDVGFAKDMAGWQLAAAFVSLVIITPIFEETIFRGLLFKRLRARLDFKTSIIIASLVFGIAHAQWNVAVDTFALSLALCWLVEKSGSIVPAIALHTLKNGLAFLLLFVIKI